MDAPIIEFEQFLAVAMHVGTIVAAAANPKAKKPALVLKIDFGPLGCLQSSAQLCQNYAAESLVGTQVIAVLNFQPKRVAGVQSEVLVLAAVSDTNGVVLLRPASPVENGTRIA